MTDPRFLHDPFGRVSPAANDADAGDAAARSDAERAERVALIDEVTAALLDERQPDRGAALFFAGAVRTWLECGGDLEKDYLRVRGPRGSQNTPRKLFRQLRGDDDDASSR